MATDDPVPQVCLAGRKVSNDWPLIQLLKGSLAVTLLERVDALASAPLLATASVLVLDAAESGGAALELLPTLHGEHAALPVLLVDGGVSQRELARAFHDGACDYFPAPYDVHLLAERVIGLCRNPPAPFPRGAPRHDQPD